MNVLRMKHWSPYVVGAGVGVLSWFAFASADHPIGITGAFENTAALADQGIAPHKEDRQDAGPTGRPTSPENRPKIGWEWMLVLGVFFGALASAALSGDRNRIVVPQLWERRFGRSASLRLLAAFAGGAVMMLGARIGKGCTSGHAISGALQLAVSSWMFAVLIFMVAIGTAYLLYGREGARHV